ncbi:response regulator transcription factor [Polaribacter aestuariivivens]|uniref:Response regulator transcription factor n=1 Tax=Polaribacter aestuariivivens TaxID=2304626 RepID=A0A5S3N427_9FLAO|nr:response regulator transcription factor [Polaribacter aestuariivivens]TMM29562.1 response regulator transcription factor [Polaribacter aestuariivivens]
MRDFKIFIADDHPILLKGLEDLLLEKQFNVIGKATNGQDALNFIIKNKPDIAILDVEMPLKTGIEIAKHCKKNKIETKIILITLHKEIDLYLMAKKIGVFGYILKEFALDEIETCIESVSKNIPYFSKDIKKHIGFTQESDTILSELSLSEKRILKLIAQHKTNKEIGHLLFISPRTVEKHRSKIILKLDLPHDTGALLTWVLKNKHLFN